MTPKLINYLSVLCMLALGVSCRQQDADTTVKTIEVDINAADAPGEIFDSYEYVMLETTDDNLIGDIKKIEITSDRIYILDQWGAKAKACYIFDRKGKYIGKIDKVGRGPGEYLSIWDIQVHDGLIYLFACENGSIMGYTETGEFVREYRLKEYSFDYFMLANDGLMWLSAEQSNDTGYNFVLYDPVNEKYVSKIDSFKKKNSFVTSYSPFNKMDDGEIYVTKRFDHTIYSLGEDELVPLYTMKFNTKDQIPEDYDQIPAAELYDRISKQWVVDGINCIVKKSDDLIVTFREIAGGQIINHMIRYDEKTGKQFHLKLGYQDGRKYPVMSNPVYIGSNFMVSYTSAMAALDMEKYYSWGLFNEDILSPEDNPVLFFWKFK